MKWTSAEDLRSQVLRLWENGILSRHLMNMDEPSLFPLRLKLKRPTSVELATHFQLVQSWIAQLEAITYLRIVRRETRHRLIGKQSVPESVWVDNVGDAIALAGKQVEAAQFQTVLEMTRENHSALLPWLAKDAVRAIAFINVWERLLAVVNWCQEHPRPGIYLRQIDLPGVDSKFIEDHRGVLSALLDLSLPTSAVALERSGIYGFAARYGFREKPRRIRFRVLDHRLTFSSGVVLRDVELDAQSFASLQLPLRRVFITENEINFLCFPDVAEAIVIFGAGYAIGAVAVATWLMDSTIHYWGDIDTHGFAILDELRKHFGHVQSFLMDTDTLMSHREHWATENEQVLRDLPRLTEVETSLYDILRDNRIGRGVRLEQERIAFHLVEAALASVECD